jgi:arylsulfatase B
MHRRRFLGTAAGALLAAPAARPNVVLFLADDLGWNDVGFHGSPIRTPHIDRIAAQGVRFTQLYAFPLCSPTRAALMTGRSPMRYGLVYSVIRPWSPYGLPADEPTMAETFRAMGYRTAMVGKWHLGHAHRRMLPNARGFDHFYGFVNADIDYYQHTHVGGLDWQRNGRSVREEGYSTDLLGAEAVRLIERRDRGKPLFLYCAFNAVHTPLQAPEDLVRKYEHIAQPNRRKYAAMTESMDNAIGRVLAAIDAQGMARDTLVLFLSDNGGPPGAGGSNTPLRGGKMTTYEGGIRVAGALRFPGKVQAAGEVRQLMHVMDILPTLAAAAGGAPPFPKELDGKNMWPQIRGAPPVEREPFFFASKRNETADYNFAVRSGDWKLVREGAAQSLFNLAQDPYEKTDVAAANRAVEARLVAELERWRQLHPKCEIQSSMTPHPGWVAPQDYAAAAAAYDPLP